MPTLSRWFIKAGMVHLVIGLLMGVVMQIQPLAGWSPQMQILRPVYLHLLFIGWVTQIIMGVGHWMFPKFSKKKPRGNEALGWAVFVLLNAGLVLRSVAEPLALLYPKSAWGGVLVLSALFLLLSGWGFVVSIWGRIKER